MSMKPVRGNKSPRVIFDILDAQDFSGVPKIEGDYFLSPQNAARYLDVSVKFIYELIQSGELKSQPIGGRLKRIRKGILDEWLTSQALKQGRFNEY